MNAPAWLSLRERAEQRLKNLPPLREKEFSEQSLADLLQELRLLRMELEIQGEDDRDLQTKAEKYRFELEACKNNQDAEFQQLNRMLCMITSCLQTILRTVDEQDLIQAICHAIHNMGGYPLAWIGVVEQHSGQSIRPLAWAGNIGDPQSLMNVSWENSSSREHPAVAVIRSGQFIIANSIPVDRVITEWEERAMKLGLQSCIALPLSFQKSRFGILTIYGAQPGTFNQKSVWLLSGLADDLAYGISTLRNRRERDGLLQERESKDELMRVLATELMESEQSQRRQIIEHFRHNFQDLLAGAQFQVECLEKEVKAQEIHPWLHNLKVVLQQALNSSQSLSQELLPPLLYAAGYGLGPALEWLSKWMNEKHGLNVQVECNLQGYVPKEPIGTLLYEMARELLYNVIKHAKTPSAQVRLELVNTNRLQLTIRDQGQGFDPRSIVPTQPPAKIFGLQKIRERLALWEGSLEIESSPGHGCRVVLRIPLIRQSGLPQTASSCPQEGPTLIQPASEEKALSRTIRVVLADDHALLRKGLAGMLMAETDMKVVGEASNGLEAVNLAIREKPDVIVMDVEMPELSGIEATRQISALLPDIRIICLSMFKSVEIASAIRNAGAIAYLQKMDPPRELLQAIRQSAFGRDDVPPGR